MEIRAVPTFGVKFDMVCSSCDEHCPYLEIESYELNYGITKTIRRYKCVNEDLCRYVSTNEINKLKGA